METVVWASMKRWTPPAMSAARWRQSSTIAESMGSGCTSAIYLRLAEDSTPAKLSADERRRSASPSARALRQDQPREVRLALADRLRDRVQPAVAALDRSHHVRHAAHRNLGVSLSPVRLRRCGADAGARDAPLVPAHAGQAVGAQ